MLRLPHSLRGLRRRNLQLFFGGQVVSLIGTWMQSVALQWLVWRLTFDPRALGAVTFLGQFPVLLFGAIGGSVADRLPRRPLVIATQVGAALQAGALAAVTLAGAVTPKLVMALAAMLGIVNAFDVPARQSLLADLAESDLTNAIALNSSVVNGTRMIGPAVAGWLVAALGEGWCFFGNAVSYLAIIAGLVAMRAKETPRQVQRGHLRAGLRYAIRTPHTRALLGLVALTSVFGLSYTALVPMFADRVLHGDARLLGTLLGAVGLGALVGAISLLRAQGLAGLGRRVAWGSSLFAGGLLLFAASRRIWLSEAALFCVGVGFMSQMASTTTLLQALAPGEMRGRVMGLYSMMFIGMTPLGALCAGWAADRIGAPRTVALGAAVVLFGSLGFHVVLPGLRRVVRRDFPALFPPQEAG
jgi:MFS family permease